MLDNSRSKPGFLRQLPLLIARLSRAIYVAVKRQILDTARLIKNLAKALWDALVQFAKILWEFVVEFVKWLGRLLIKTIRWLWATYCALESRLLNAIVDLALAIIALRFIAVLTLLGILLAIARQWLLLTAYLVFLLIAVLRHFQIERNTQQEEEEYKRSRATFVAYLRWPLRLLTSIALFVGVVFFEPSKAYFDLASLYHSNRSTPSPSNLVKNDSGPVEAKTTSKSEAGSVPTLAEPPPPTESAAPSPPKPLEVAPALKAATAPPASYDEIYLENSCNEKAIVVAVYYQSVNTHWITRGWYHVPPKQTILTNVRSKANIIFFYAESDDATDVWEASDEEESRILTVKGGRFARRDGQPLDGEDLRDVKFFGRSTGTEYGAFTQRFSCE